MRRVQQGSKRRKLAEKGGGGGRSFAVAHHGVYQSHQKMRTPGTVRIKSYGRGSVILEQAIATIVCEAPKTMWKERAKTPEDDMIAPLGPEEAFDIEIGAPLFAPARHGDAIYGPENTRRGGNIHEWKKVRVSDCANGLDKGAKYVFVGISKTQQKSTSGKADTAVTAVHEGTQTCTNWSPFHHKAGGKVGFSMQPYVVILPDGQKVPGVEEVGIHPKKYRFATVPMDDTFYNGALMRSLEAAKNAIIESGGGYDGAVDAFAAISRTAREVARAQHVEGADTTVQPVDLYRELEILCLLHATKPNSGAVDKRDILQGIIDRYRSMLDKGTLSEHVSLENPPEDMFEGDDPVNMLNTAAILSKYRLMFIADHYAYCETYFMGTCLRDCQPGGPLHLRVNS
jgi:hypothetical protein